MVQRRRLKNNPELASEEEKPHDPDMLRSGAPANRNGRKPGSKNRAGRILREAILDAAAKVGKDRKGKRELVGYLEMLAEDYPKTFATLLGRVIPLQVTGKDNGPIRVLHLDPTVLGAMPPEALEILNRVFTGQPVRDSQQPPDEADEPPSENMYGQLLLGGPAG